MHLAFGLYSVYITITVDCSFSLSLLVIHARFGLFLLRLTKLCEDEGCFRKGNLKQKSHSCSKCRLLSARLIL